MSMETILRRTLSLAKEGDPAAMGNAAVAYFSGEGVEADLRLAASWAQKANQAGDARGTFILGCLHQEGSGGVLKDVGKAQSCFEKAADSGHAEAWLALGHLHLEGVEGVPRNARQAMTCFEAALEKGDGVQRREAREGLRAVGSRLRLGGVGEAVDLPGAKAALERAATLGDAWAMVELADVLMEEQCFPEAERWLRKALDEGEDGANSKLMQLALTKGNFKEAMKWAKAGAECDCSDCIAFLEEAEAASERRASLEKAAKKGHLEALQELYRMDSEGIGVPRDPAKAEAWQRKIEVLEAEAEGALLQGRNPADPEARYDLGRAFWYGERVGKHPKKALALMQQAADLGFPKAFNALGLMLGESGTSEEDGPRAKASFERAIEAGHVRALFNLGTLYLDGAKGLKPDAREGIRCFEQAAESGDVDAMDMLGRMYTLGMGIPEDMEKGLAWYQRAAERGSEEGASRLGLAHLNRREYDKAIPWLEKAVARGNASLEGSLKEAKKKKGMVRVLLAPEEDLVKGTGAPLSAQALKAQETRMGHSLTGEYAQFLQRFNGVDFKATEHRWSFDVSDQGEPMELRRLYGIATGNPRTDLASVKLDPSLSRAGLLLVGEDACGNGLVQATQGTFKGQVLLWDSESGEGFEGDLSAMVEEGVLVQIAPSFERFLASLYRMEKAPKKVR